MAVDSSKAAATVSREVDHELKSLYEKVRQSVVLVYRGGGSGAGTIWGSDGLIVTNNHVVNAEGEANVVLADGRKLKAIVAARHPTRDLALLKVAASNLPAIVAADSAQVRPGELAIAIGHPNGFRDAMTFGVVVAIESAAYAGAGGRENMLLSDARFGPGNSGGPVVNAAGAVIGICSRVSGRLGMSVPSQIVSQFVDGAFLPQQRDYLGFDAVEATISQNPDTFGLVITALAPEGPATTAGLRLGDIVLSVDDYAIAAGESLATLLGYGRTQHEVRLGILRGGSPLTIVVEPTIRHPETDHQH